MLPDRVFVYGPHVAINSISYTDIRYTSSEITFIESEPVPLDAIGVGTTWQYVNKDGSPDRRFNNNRELPILRYGILELEGISGLRLTLHISKPALAQGATTLLTTVKDAIRIMQAQPSKQPSTQNRSFVLPTALPPPLPVDPEETTIQLSELLTLSWLPNLPEWASSMACGILLVLPVVPGVFAIRSGLSWITGIFLGLTLALAIYALIVLVRGGNIEIFDEDQEEEEEEEHEYSD